MKNKRCKLFLLIGLCVLVYSCGQRVEVHENYQNKNSTLIPLLPEVSDLGASWRIEKIFSAQFEKSDEYFDENMEEMARRYFWGSNSEVDGRLLLLFQVYRFSVLPKIPEGIPFRISGEYELVESKFEGIIRYENCKQTTLELDYPGCRFVSVSNPLLMVLSITAVSQEDEIIDKIKLISVQILEITEAKMLMWEK